MTAYKKPRIATKLEKAVSTINQAIKLSEVENGEMETWDKSLSKVEFIDKYFRPYIKIMQICEKQRSCGYDSSPWKYLNGTTNGSYNSPFNYGRVPFIFHIILLLIMAECLLFQWMEFCIHLRIILMLFRQIMIK